jgi:hypothetical protein
MCMSAPFSKGAFFNWGFVGLTGLREFYKGRLYNLASLNHKLKTFYAFF